MTAYTWNITTKKKVNKDSYSDVIVQVYWTKIGERNGKTAAFNGCCSFTLNSDVEFIPYENVTDSMVINWIENTVDQNYVNTRIEQLLDLNSDLPLWQI